MQDNNIKNQLSTKYSVIFFQANWCAPCIVVKPFFKKISNEYEKYADFEICNVDDKDSYAIFHKIKSIPTVLILKNKKEIKRINDTKDIVKNLTHFLNDLFEITENNISAK